MLSDGPTADAIYHQLYEAHAGAVLTYLTNKLRDPDTAEDVAQDAWLRAHRFLPGALAERGVPVKAWVMRIADNAMIDHFRRVQARPKAQDIDDMAPPGVAVPDVLRDDETPEQMAVAGDEHDERRRAAALVLELLSHRDRQLLWLREWRGYSYEEMAVALRATASGIKSRLFRARAAQRVLWERDLALRVRFGGGVEARLWRFVGGGRSWALAHPDDCWTWLGAVGGLKRAADGTIRTHPTPHITTHTGGAMRPGARGGVTPSQSLQARRLLYALVRGALPPWVYLEPCPRDSCCPNPYHAATLRMVGRRPDGGKQYGHCDPAVDPPGRTPADTPDDAGPALRRRRLRLGLTLDDLAAAAGIARASFHDIEHDRLVSPVLVATARRAVAEAEARYTVVPADGREVRRAREAAGLTTRAMAQLAGLSYSQVTRIESGRCTARPPAMRRIQDALDRLERDRQETAA